MLRTFLLLSCLLLAACSDTAEPKNVPAKVDTVLKNKVILHTDEDFVFLDSPSPNWDWRDSFKQGDKVTLVPTKDGKNYARIILKNGRAISFNN